MLSAVEGLKVETPAFDAYVVPITVVILFVLFIGAVARHRQGRRPFSGRSLWSGSSRSLPPASGTSASNPAMLSAFNPIYGIYFLLHHGIIGFVTLGAVFLAVTGAEALYADLGHFGRGPIQAAWLVRGAAGADAELSRPGRARCWPMPDGDRESVLPTAIPSWALLPMVVLATAATVIASQAVITGAYSLTRQAIQLGLLPRLEIRHTSEALFGQIYMPRVNSLLLVGVLLLVALFRSSSALASAYGIAVTGTMVVTALMAIVVIRRVWGWPLAAALALMVPFLFIDLTFLAANLLKVVEGGWMPLALGALVMTLMYTWRRGSRLLFEKTRKQEMPLQSLIVSLEKKPPHVVRGTAVFFTSDPEFAPTALLHSLKHYKVLHEKNVILTIVSADTPRVAEDDRVKITPLSPLFSRVTLRFGFMESPNVPKALAIARKLGWQFDIMSTSFFLSRRSLKPAAHSGMPRWQDRLFIGLTRAANDATDYFQIPTGRVVEVGTQVTV